MKGIFAKHPDFGASIIRDVIPHSDPILVRVDYLDMRLTGQTELLSKFVDTSTGKQIRLESEDEHEPKEANRRKTIEVDCFADDQTTARKAIMALRLGQCPSKFIKRLTVGAEEVQSACEWALKRAKSRKPAFILFESPFGKGKTHALNLLAYEAEMAGFAVGNVVLDGVGTSLSLPMSLLGALVNGIRFPIDSGVESLSERLCTLVHNRTGAGLGVTGANTLAECLAAIPREIAEQPDAWDIVVDYLSCELAVSQAKGRLRKYSITGRPIKIPAIVANSRDERPRRCALMLKEWAQACTRLGAPGGLLVSLDEADVDYGNSGFSSAIGEQRNNLLDELSKIAENETSSAPLIVAIAITPGESTRGSEDPVQELLTHLGVKFVKHVVLGDLEQDHFIKLGVNVSNIYNQAYCHQVFSDGEARRQAKLLFQNMTNRYTEGCVPRTFVRHFIELLDLSAIKKLKA
jgi:hypothetical protein